MWYRDSVLPMKKNILRAYSIHMFWQNGYNISKKETSNTKHTYRM